MKPLWLNRILAASGILISALIVALILFGFRLFSIMTPSMGQTAPVGSLVVTHSYPAYHQGEIITFVRERKMTTHRVVDITSSGSYVTKGDLNSVVDPWTVGPSEVVGRAVWISPGLGWLLRGLPYLIIGFIVVYLFSLLKIIPETWRWSVRFCGYAIVFSLVGFWLRPWINFDVLGFQPADGGGMLLRIVNTGLFPIDADGTRLLSGQAATVHLTEQNWHGLYSLVPHAWLGIRGLIVVMLFCLMPTILALLIRPGDSKKHLSSKQRAQRARQWLYGVIICGVVAAIVSLIFYTSSFASLTGKVTTLDNSADTTVWSDATPTSTTDTTVPSSN